MLANYYFITGRYPEAKPILYKFMSDQDLFLKLVRVLEFESDYHEAVRLLEERTKTDSSNTIFLAKLADNYMEIDRFLSANNTLEKIIELNPGDITSLAKLANLNLKMKKLQRTIELCEQGLEQDSTNRTLIRIKGLASFRMSAFSKSAECFNYLFTRGDSSTNTLKHLGISETKLFQMVPAREHLIMAYQKDSTDFELCYFIAQALNATTYPDSALYYLDRADSLLLPSPGVLEVLLIERASAYFMLEDWDYALNTYRELYKVHAKPQYLFSCASICQHHLSDKKKALEYYTRFLDALPEEEHAAGFRPEEQHTVSLKRVAQENVERLKEELFFEGKLE